MGDKSLEAKRTYQWSSEESKEFEARYEEERIRKAAWPLQS